jgi:hypothetical protein
MNERKWFDYFIVLFAIISICVVGVWYKVGDGTTMIQVEQIEDEVYTKALLMDGRVVDQKDFNRMQNELQREFLLENDVEPFVVAFDGLCYTATTESTISIGKMRYEDCMTKTEAIDWVIELNTIRVQKIIRAMRVWEVVSIE